MKGGRRMIRKIPRFFLFFLCIVLISRTVFLSSSALANKDTPSIDAAASLFFYHVETDTTVLSKEVDQTLPAGPTCKLLAGLLFCEQLQGRLGETVLITADMVADSVGYSLGLEAGDQLSVTDLLYAALCGGYNDAYDVLACFIAGSKEAFVAQMNQRAQSLGAAATRFSDVSGIDDSSLTSAADLFQIAQTARNNPLYVQISSTVFYTIPSLKKIENRNKLLSSPAFYNEQCKGMSAGATNRAGNCLIAQFSNGRETYICVILGVAEDDGQYKLANDLLKWVNRTYSYVEVISPDTVVCKLPVTVSDLTTEIEIKTDQSRSCFLPYGVEIGKDITYSIRLTYTELEAPVNAGTQVGFVAIMWNGKILDTVPLYTADGAERSSFLNSLKQIQTLTQNRVFVSGALFFILSLATWLITEWIIQKRKHKKWDKYFSAKITPLPDHSYSHKRTKR